MTQITITLPTDLYEDLKELAEAEHRSLTGQVRFILDRWVSAADTEAKEEVSHGN